MIATVALTRAAYRLPWLLWVYLLLIAAAELLTLLSPPAGMAIHALLLMALLVQGASGEPGPERHLMLALSLVPLIRLLSLSLPLAAFPQIAWYPIVALPLMTAAWTVVRLLRLPCDTLGLRLGDFRPQLVLAGAGVGLGVLEYTILTPRPLNVGSSLSSLALAALILVISTGFVEEFIFRGLILSLALPALKRRALVYVSLLFAALHIGYGSLADLAFVFSVGMLFATVVRLSGSIVGVSLAHGLANVTLYIVMPYLSQQPQVAAIVAPCLLWSGAGLALAAIVMVASTATIETIARAKRPAVANLRSLWATLVRISLDATGSLAGRWTESRRHLFETGRAAVGVARYASRAGFHRALALSASHLFANPGNPRLPWRPARLYPDLPPQPLPRPVTGNVSHGTPLAAATAPSCLPPEEPSGQERAGGPPDCIHRVVVDAGRPPSAQLLETLKSVPDPRSSRGRRHTLPTILALATYAMLCGAPSVYAVARWSRDQEPGLLTDLGMTQSKSPCAATFNRVFVALDAAAFDAALRRWARMSLSEGEQAVGVDCEGLRGIRGAPLPGVRLAASREHQVRRELGLLPD